MVVLVNLSLSKDINYAFGTLKYSSVKVILSLLNCLESFLH